MSWRSLMGFQTVLIEVLFSKENWGQQTADRWVQKHVSLQRDTKQIKCEGATRRSKASNRLAPLVSKRCTSLTKGAVACKKFYHQEEELFCHAVRVPWGFVYWQMQYSVLYSATYQCHSSDEWDQCFTLRIKNLIKNLSKSGHDEVDSQLYVERLKHRGPIIVLLCAGWVLCTDGSSSHSLITRKQ